MTAGNKPQAASALRPLAYLAALGAVILALALAELLLPAAGLENVDLVFLAAVVAFAAFQGLGPALLAAVAGVLAYNFFFIPPIHTFEVADAKNVAALGFFLAFALATSHVGARVRNQALTAQRQAAQIETLYEVSRRIAGAADADALASVGAERIAALLNRDAFLLLPDGIGALQLRGASGPRASDGDGIDLFTVNTFWEGGTWAERRVMRIGDHLFYPLRDGGRLAGLVALSQRSLSESLSLEEEALFEAVAEQLAVAVGRMRVGAERDEARRAAEGERLRNGVLSSLSHDLKTPLASILGAASALRDFPGLYEGAAREELLATIADEAERMTSFVANLLDMSRIEAGGVLLAREPTDLNELIGTALHRLERKLAGHRVQVRLAPDPPSLMLDPVLIEQVFVNLLDNVANYAPAGSLLTIASVAGDGEVEITFADEGPGLPKERPERVFDKFFRARQGDRRRAGTGLGLAIARAFVEANGGTIAAANRRDGAGAVFTLRWAAGEVQA